VPHFQSRTRKVLTVRVDVALVLDELVVDHLLQVAALRAQLREPVDHILDQVEPVDPFWTLRSKGVVIVPSSL